MDEHEHQAHFRKRRRQLIAACLTLFAIIIVAAGLLFTRDLKAAKRDQQWALWRDDHCTSEALSRGKTVNTMYQEARYRGQAATWSCDDGRNFNLSNSDKAPADWSP